MYVRMKATDTPVFPSPPSLMAALMGGFDTITNRVGLILFPIVLDMLLWLGPHFRLKLLVDGMLNQMAAFATSANPQAVEAVKVNQELWEVLGSRLNLMTALRTYPVGVPSLMAGRLPEGSPVPYGNSILEVPNIGYALGIWALLSLLGLLAASFYFILVAQATSPGKRCNQSALSEWPRSAVQVILLTFLWAAIIGGISVPASCIVSALALTNPSIGRFALIMYGGGLLWLMFPLLFSPHGIFVHRANAVASLKRSIRVIRMTLPTTGIFFLMIIVLSQGLDILWRIPPEDSWFTLIGILGHAFITTGLLAASFIYYQEADQWVQKMMIRLSGRASV
jgi:hypothetical protein